MGFKTVAQGVLVREDKKRTHKGRPDRYYTIRYRVGGKRHQEALGWASEGWNLTKAQTELARLKAAAVTGDGAVTLRQRREEAQAKREAEENAPTLQKVWEAYAETLQGRGGYRAAKSHIKKHLQDLLPIKIENLRTLHLEQLKRKMEAAGYAPQTVKHSMALVRRIVRWGATHGLCVMPPLHELHFDMPSFDNTVTEFLTDKQIQNLLLALDRYPDQNLANAMRLALCTGLRRTAIFSLRWGDVSFERKQICLRAETAKNRRTAHIPLTPNAERILRDVRPTVGENSELIFGQRNAYNPAVKKLMNYIARYLPSGYRPWHSLRHTFASLLASSGAVDLLTLKTLLTHRDATATQRYAHLADEATRRAASVMDTIFKQAVNDATGQEPTPVQSPSRTRARVRAFRPDSAPLRKKGQ